MDSVGHFFQKEMFFFLQLKNSALLRRKAEFFGAVAAFLAHQLRFYFIQLYLKFHPFHSSSIRYHVSRYEHLEENSHSIRGNYEIVQLFQIEQQ